MPKEIVLLLEKGRQSRNLTSIMTDPEHLHQNPFVLEAIYRETAAAVAGGELDDPDKVLRPMIELYLSQRGALFESALGRYTR